MSKFNTSSTLCYLGQQFGNYKLIRLLGQGGFADVYLGKHVYLNRFGAVKILHMRSEQSNVDMQPFFEEARIAAQLNHPHIVRVLEFGVEKQVPFLVMDYAPGGTLRLHYPTGVRLVPAVVLKYVQQLAEAVEYIHSKGFIHRDIKPENMLLGPDNELLLSDFGLTIAAQAIADDDLVACGTAVYMAPEQIEGNPCLQSDQYALGVVVYEWLNGYPPFQGTVEEIINQHFNPMLPSLCASVLLVPLAVENVVFKALAINPQERFESVQAFAHALQDAFEPRPAVIRDNDLHDSQLQQLSLSKQGRTKEQRKRNAQAPVTGDIAPKRGPKRSRGTKSTWNEIALFYAVDLLAAAALERTLAALGTVPFLLVLFLALLLTLFPLVGALVRKNTTLFFLTLSITIVSTMAALLFSSFVTFDVTYIGLLLLSLLTAFAVIIHDTQ